MPFPKFLLHCSLAYPVNFKGKMRYPMIYSAVPKSHMSSDNIGGFESSSLVFTSDFTQGSKGSKN